MKQFIINSAPDKDSVIRFEGDDYHYLVHVRRLAPGEYFPALLPNNEEALVQVISIDNGALTGKLSDSPPLSDSARSPANIPQIILFQALPKGDKMDMITRQAAEGGIAEIVPFVSEFSHGKTNIGREKFSRWQRIIKEARQQSGSKTATALSPPLAMDDLFVYWNKLKTASSEPDILGLLFHHLPPRSDEKNLSGGLEQNSLHGYLNSNRKIVVLVIGPEGGFSGGEVSLFLKHGFFPLTIGNTVLRTETAALYCAAAIRILLLERDSWELRKK